MSPQSQPTDPPPLDTNSNTSATLLLPSNRTLSYATYGSPTGTPILYHHGFPGSRLEAAHLDLTAKRVNARIIAIDRPGIGRSTPHDSRTFQSYAEDVQSLTEHLGLKSYGVLGVSGGGPYALACARFLPFGCVRGVTIVCGLGPPDMGYYGMKWMNYLGWTFGQRYLPRLCGWWFAREPGARLDLSERERLVLHSEAFEKERDKGGMHEKDVAVFGDEEFMRVTVCSMGESYAQGVQVGVVRDFRVLGGEWGFDLRDIGRMGREGIPVFLWYGDLDGNVPLHHGIGIQERIGESAKLRVMSGETHASIWKGYMGEYIGELVGVVEGSV